METKFCPESKKVFGKFQKQFLLSRLRYCVFYICCMMVQMMRHLGNIVQTPTLNVSLIYVFSFAHTSNTYTKCPIKMPIFYLS